MVPSNFALSPENECFLKIPIKEKNVLEFDSYLPKKINGVIYIKITIKEKKVLEFDSYLPMKINGVINIKIPIKEKKCFRM